MSFRNYYYHVECSADWTDDWDCACNDDCPSCGAEIEPYMSVELTDDGNETDDIVIWADKQYMDALPEELKIDA
jgi:hypothetical protein